MPLHSWLKILQAIFQIKGSEPIWQRRGRKFQASSVRLRLEELEDRLAPASVSDGGTGALSIVQIATFLNMLPK